MTEYFEVKKNPELIERKVLEQIREEIEKARDRLHPTWSEGARAQYVAFMYCLHVIDTHTGGMSPEVEEHYKKLGEYYNAN